jgi:hypothetical protein
MDALLAAARTEMFMPGVEVICAGEHLEQLHILVSGSIRVSGVRADGCVVCVCYAGGFYLERGRKGWLNSSSWEGRTRREEGTGGGGGSALRGVRAG